MQNLKRSISNTETSSTKKPRKTTSSQSNTLLNYFVTNKPIKKPEAETSKNTILNYFKVDFSSKKIEEAPTLELEEDTINSIKVKPEQDDFTIKTERAYDQEPVSTALSKVEKIEFGLEDEKSVLNLDESKNVPKRKCPFYKRIEGTQIVVDAFSYGNIENCNAYFLSHYHYDHFIGLQKNFQNHMFCSKITANLVLKKIKVESKYVHPLELNKFLNVYPNDDSIQVALLDANHCPGSVMFLFKFKKTGKYILHTGDFRASDELIQNRMLQNIKLDTVHLDTTYCDSYYKFLPQSKVVALGVDTVSAIVKSQPRTLIVCGSYTIGKERVFIAIAEYLNLRVFVTRDKMNIISCLEDENLLKRITLNPEETSLHVIPMGQLNIKDLQEYLKKFPSYDNLVAIKPTGWTHKEDSNSNLDKIEGLSIEKKSKNIVIYGLEYSEHSSFEELHNFVSTLKPRKIIPTVSVYKKETRDKMQSYFNEWLSR